jgi:excisionase family DNA binding protein
VTKNVTKLAGRRERMTIAPRGLLTVEQAAERLSIGRTSMFALLKAGDIESVKVGRLRRIPADALDRYVSRLVAEQHATA